MTSRTGLRKQKITDASRGVRNALAVIRNVQTPNIFSQLFSTTGPNIMRGMPLGKLACSGRSFRARGMKDTLAIIIDIICEIATSGKRNLQK